MVTATLSAVFGAGVRYRNGLYDSGSRKPRELQGPVVSVGNISVGGSGKTPFTILLGGLLRERGVKFDVLSRGYGRESKGTRIVDPGGSAREFGDEPLLIARKLGIPVVLGEERYEAGLLAEKTYGPQLHLLDDGFQHRQLARQFDIVLLTPEDVRGRLLPAGRLREPLASLRRADAVVLMGDIDRAMIPADAKETWRVSRGLAVENVSRRPVAFCGIARPEAFFAQLRASGIEPVAECSFRDHHAYSDRDIRDLRETAQLRRAGGFVTTEKDLVNLGERREALEPLSVASVTMNLENSGQVLTSILDTLARRGKPVA